MITIITPDRQICHPFGPIFAADSKILILGSFPSVKSREQMFFYGHPQNRFWRVTAAVFNCPPPDSIAQKTEFLLSHKIALWDVIASCSICGSSDSSIRDVVPNDISAVLRGSSVQKIFTNGKTAHSLYLKYILPRTEISDICLPSTSPANAAYSLSRLTEKWAVIAQPPVCPV